MVLQKCLGHSSTDASGPAAFLLLKIALLFLVVAPDPRLRRGYPGSGASALSVTRELLRHHTRVYNQPARRYHAPVIRVPSAKEMLGFQPSAACASAESHTQCGANNSFSLSRVNMTARPMTLP